jgi:hypothetical protein
MEPEGRQGSMKTHRRIITSVGLLLTAAACMPATAHANPLLSGYGGPGQGNQAILGGTLLNGSGGGGSSGAVAAATSSGYVSGEGTSTTSAARAGSQGAGAPKASGGASPRAAQRVHRPSAGRHPQDPESIYRALERSSSASAGGSLALSGSEVVLIALALVALATIGVVTRRIARPKAAGGHG